MGIFFVLLFAALAAKTRHKKDVRRVNVLYRTDDGQIVGDEAIFRCGCRFHWVDGTRPPKLCAAHKAIVEAEVAA